MSFGKYQFIVGDALKTGLPDKSVDLVFGSPPYEAQRTYSIGFNMKGQDWVDWMVAGFREWLRVSRGLVAMVVEGFTRDFRYSASPLLLMADLHRAGITLRKPPAFHRIGIPGSGGPDWLRNDFEFIVCATNGGKLPWSENTAMGHPPRWAPGGEMSHRLSDGTRRNQWGGGEKSTGRERQKSGEIRRAKPKPSHRMVMTRDRDGVHAQTTPYAPPVKANPGNLVQCNVGGGLMGHKLAHENEAPFPETLPNFFVRSFCPPGGIVLDPFSGSGTTVAAAVKAGRNAVGIDIRPQMINIGRRRLQDVIGGGK
jgi:hypothetical protein